MREPGAHRIGVALAVAFGLHAALFVALALSPRPALSGAIAPAATAELAIDVEATTAETTATTPAAAEAPATTPLAVLERVRERPAPPAEPASGPASEPAPVEAPALAASAEAEVAAAAAPAAAAPAAAPALGLAELGIGHALPPQVLGAATEATGVAPSTLQRGDETARARSMADNGSTKERSETRLEHSLRADMAARDQKRGLGPEAPVVLALERLTYADATTAANGEATVRVRVDGNGMLTAAEIVSASSDTDAWRRILEALMKELGREPLRRVPPRGASIEIKLVSREQLPSGASPGLQVDVLGIPVSHGRGPNPTKIQLFSPVAIQLPIPGDPDGVTLPMIGLGFGVFGDLADIGATARRVVRARVTKYEVY